MSILLIDCDFKKDVHLLRFLKFLSYKKEFYFYNDKNIICKYTNFNLSENATLPEDHIQLTIGDFIHSLNGYTLVQFNIDASQTIFDTELYNVCRQSVIDNVEFDNYLNFSSLAEIYDYFPMIESDCKEYEEFLEAHYNVLIYLLDIVRMALTKYIKNIIYIDSDIQILSKLSKNDYTDNFVLFKPGTDFFFSKEFGEVQKLCLKYLNKNYTNDYDFYKNILSEKVKLKECNFIDYSGLLAGYQKIVICLNILEADELITHYIESHSSENILFVLPKKLCLYKYYFNKKVIANYKYKESIDLYVSEVNILYKPKISLIDKNNNLPKKKLLKYLFNFDIEESQII